MRTHIWILALTVAVFAVAEPVAAWNPEPASLLPAGPVAAICIPATNICLNLCAPQPFLLCI